MSKYKHVSENTKKYCFAGVLIMACSSHLKFRENMLPKMSSNYSDNDPQDTC